MMKVPLSKVGKLDGEGGSSQGSCNQGGCSQGNCDGAPAAFVALDEKFVSAALDLVSVKVPSMDTEHGQCAAALRQLAQWGSRASVSTSSTRRSCLTSMASGHTRMSSSRRR